MGERGRRGRGDAAGRSPTGGPAGAARPLLGGPAARCAAGCAARWLSLQHKLKQRVSITILDNLRLIIYIVDSVSRLILYIDAVSL
jgi:hypothetical protein